MPVQRKQKPIGVFYAGSNTYSRLIAIAAAYRVRHLGYRPVILFGIGSKPDPNLAGYVGLFSRDTADMFLAAGTPAVNVSQHGTAMLRLPSVLADNRAAGRLAAEHLIERGYNTIVYINREPLFYSELRGDGVRDAVALKNGRYVELSQANMATELKTLPLPLGIVGADDTMASRALETVLSLGRHVPDQVAVVGITNDEIDCITAPVVLSSVDLNASIIGDRAARLLLRLVAGRPVPSQPVIVAPGGVVTRASSDMLATADPVVAKIVRYARDHLSDGLRVHELARHFGMSRQNLHLLFREKARYAPVEMLQHLAVARAKQLLVGSDLSINLIAAQCGYDNLAHFGVMFRQLTGTTPAAYRNQWPAAGY